MGVVLCMVQAGAVANPIPGRMGVLDRMPLCCFDEHQGRDQRGVWKQVSGVTFVLTSEGVCCFTLVTP